MQLPQNAVLTHFGEPPEQYKTNAILPPNPLLGLAATTEDELEQHLQQHHHHLLQFWTADITDEQLEYCAQLAEGDLEDDGLGEWLALLNEEGGMA